MNDFLIIGRKMVAETKEKEKCVCPPKGRGFVKNPDKCQLYCSLSYGKILDLKNYLQFPGF